jgi:aspartyl/asparaginyl-tRNA synthetase
MQEKLIRNIALICTAAGLILLYYASVNIGNSPVKIGKITSDSIGMGMKVCGIVESTKIPNDNVFLLIRDDTGSIELVIFATSALNLNNSGIDLYSLYDEDEICLTGILDEYPKGSGRLEIKYEGGNITLYD